MNIKVTLYLILGVLYCITSQSQALKDSLLYSRLNNKLLTANGKRILVEQYYNFDKTKDSIFIFDNYGNLHMKEKSSNQYTLFGDNLFITTNKSKKKIEILNPFTLKNNIIKNASELVIVNKLSLILYLDNHTNLYKLIKMVNDNPVIIASYKKEEINFIDINSNLNTMIVQSFPINKGVDIIDLNNFTKISKTQIDYPIKHVFWDKKYPIVFLSPLTGTENNYSYITFYNYKNNFSKTQLLNSTGSFTDLEAISDTSFKIKQHYPIGKKPYNTNELQIWSTASHSLNQIDQEADLSDIYMQENVIFDYKKNKVYQPENYTYYNFIGVNDSLFLTYNSNQYNDYTYSWVARPRDIGLFNPITNTYDLIAKKQADPSNTTSLSPNRDFFVYYQNNQIHFYNIKEKKILTSYKVQRYAKRFKDTYQEFEGKLWSEDQKYFYFISNASILRYNTIKNKIEILQEASNKTTYYKFLNNTVNNANNKELSSNTIINDSQLLIQQYNPTDNTQSLYLLKDQKKEYIIDNTNQKISDILYSKKFETITYALENFNQPRTIFIYKNKKITLLLNNNMPNKLYAWKKQKMITYKDRYGNSLKGILYYPKNFDQSNKYPLITKIYEHQSNLANTFNYPTFLNSNGFNIDLYLEKNYFVFLPDILNIHQGPGLSALNCVEESIKSVLQQEKSIDKDNLGLFGFSLGGYETNFIITHSDLFKTAVSGSGPTDLVNFYFSYNQGYISPNYFVFKNGQFDMPKTFEEDKKLYYMNSPIHFVNQIKTPLLSFAGEEDKIVNSLYQKEFFIGLLRYRIPHVSLFYKNESHTFRNRNNQIDITNRIMNWFDYYLKNIDSKDTYWVKYNTTIDKAD